MPFWLADQRRDQDASHIQRFDPRFWTVNFPRPMMASVVTTAPDALRVDAVFYHGDALAGLIWDSVDSLDHPLLAYSTDRNYEHSHLRFRWRSSGVKPLDAVHGPTLTIEGRDSEGAARSWYVRLWNYASGTPEDAEIVLPFSALDGGFLLPGEADPVHPGDIDRMFISIVPQEYDASPVLLASPREAWVEISDLACEGHRAILEIGDVLVPPHGLAMATAYDDSFNQTPARLLRSIEALGYRGPINHYCGMSHYFRLSGSGGDLLVDEGAALNVACEAWHRDFAGRAAQLGFAPIFSLSYEMFAEHCPEPWQQRAENGDPALTGWDPPSALLSPANADAMAYVQVVVRAFAAILVDASLPVRFQIGEPWWWIMADGRICLYDDAAVAAFGGAPVSLPDIRAPLDSGQIALLDAAGALLASSTDALADAVRDEAGEAGAEILLLVYLPTVLDDQAPHARRANVPPGWAWPAYDVLQLEDYDWVSAGNFAAQRKGLAAMDARLGYPAAQQHYLSGFVLRPEDEAQWTHIVRAAEDARDRDVAARFIWALPQVARDGFTYFRIEGTGSDDVNAFDPVDFPLHLGRDAQVTGSFSTRIVTGLSGHELRNTQWADARLSYDVGGAIRSESDLGDLLAFFRARRGPARAFRFRDPIDHSSSGMSGTPAGLDQQIGIGDGTTAAFPLVKRYGEGEDDQLRRITRPVASSIAVTLNGAAASGWSLEPGGIIAFETPPADGDDIRAGFLFDVPVRFADDSLSVSLATFAAGEALSVLLAEVREAV
ncbi:MAG: DUF2460 domain-containing protein [Blastomonas sp.]